MRGGEAPDWHDGAETIFTDLCASPVISIRCLSRLALPLLLHIKPREMIHGARALAVGAVYRLMGAEQAAGRNVVGEMESTFSRFRESQRRLT